MTPERWQEIQRLLAAALERTPTERGPFLDQACTDPDLRREVESLIAAHEQAHTVSSSTPPIPLAELAPGSRIGTYEILGRIGVGGMGVVYRALDTKLNRPVAIKFLADGLAGPEARRRFQREAQMASSLNHPHILTVYDAGQFQGRDYLVMEFVDGGTLKTWARSANRTWRETVELLTGVADGLAAAHTVGILHRDIKPDNILVATNGYAKLADFGLAKLAESFQQDVTRTLLDDVTHPGVVVGTMSYMSPEQAAGMPVDARSDIFSFGVVLYEILNGKRPFTGNTYLQLLQAIQSAPAAPLSNKDLPLPLCLAIEKALEKDPVDRYQSMRDLVVDLKRLARRSDPGLVITSEPLPAVSSPRPRDWNRIAAAVMIFVLILAAAGTGWLWMRSRSARPLPRLEFIQLTNFADSAVSPTLSPDGRVLAFIRGKSTFEGAGEVYAKLLPDGTPVQLTHDGLVKEGPVAFSPDSTHIAYTAEGSVGETWTVPVSGGEPSVLLPLSSALSWIASASGPPHVMFSWLTGEGNIHMAVYQSTETRADLRAVYIPANVTGMAHRSFLSPDGKHVLIVEMDLGSWLPCRVVPFDGSSLGFRVGPQPAQCTDAAWSPDGNWIYVSANTGNGFHIWRQRFPDGTPEQLTSGATEEQGLSFAADGRSFVTSVGTSESTLWVHDSHGNHQITSEGFAFLPSFSADGKTLYYLVRSHASRRFVSGELWAANLDTGRASRLLPDFVMESYNVSRDGKNLVFLGIDETGRSVVWLAPLDGSAPPRRLASQEYAARAMFDPAGGVLFVGGQEGVTFLYHVNEDGSGLQKLIPAQVSYLYAISPQGHAIAAWVGQDVYVYSQDGKSQTLICRYCATAGEENRGITPPLLAWSPDERFLYVHSTRTQETYVVPLPPGRLLPSLPPDGLSRLSDVAKLPGASVLPEHRSFGGADPSVYAYPIVTTHRNIYRIPVPQ